MRPAALIALLCCLFAVACGSRHSDPGGTAFFEQQLAALDKLPQPDGIAPARWSELKSALRAMIVERIETGRTSSSAPSSNASKTTLAFNSADGSLSWGYYSAGDYDQNSEVNVSDLTPLAVHLNQTVPADKNSIEAVVDGDNNGQINIADLTPLGANLGNRVTAYNIYSSQDSGEYPASNTAPSSLIPVWTLQFNTATGTPTTGRLQYAFTVPSPAAGDIYWVRPEDGSGDGTPSNMTGPGAPLESSITLNQVSFEYPDGTSSDHTAWGRLDLTFRGVDALLYLNATYNGTQVLTDVPVVSTEGTGVLQTLSMPFDLGVADGAPVTEGQLEYTLETVPKGTSSLKHVSDGESVPVQQVKEGVNEQTPPAAPLKDFGFADPHWNLFANPVYNQGMPVQEVGRNEEAAGAVSDSLQWLRARHALAIGGSTGRPIDLATMRQALGEVMLDGHYQGPPNDWPQNKDKYMKDHDYPVTTSETSDLSYAYAAMADGADVELICEPEPSLGQRVVTLKAITLTGDGGGWIQYNIDSMPGEPGGLTGVIRRIGAKNDPEMVTAWLGVSMYWGEVKCHFVIEQPLVTGEHRWQGKKVARYGGIQSDALAKPNGWLEVAYHDFFHTNITLANINPLGLTTVAQAADPGADSSGPVGLKLVANGDDDGWLTFTVEQAQHELKNAHFSTAGNQLQVDAPQVLASEPIQYFSAVQGYLINGKQSLAFYNSSDLQTIEALDAQSSAFGALQTVNTSYGFEPSLLYAPFGSILAWRYSTNGVIRLINHYNFSTGSGDAVLELGSDVQHFTMVADTIAGTTYIIYQDSLDQVFLMSSTNGTDWTAPLNIYDGSLQALDAQWVAGRILMAYFGEDESANWGLYYGEIDPDDPQLFPELVGPLQSQPNPNYTVTIVYNAYLNRAQIIGPSYDLFDLNLYQY